MSTLTLTDAAGTPVNRSFGSTQSSPDLTVWKDYATNSGYPVGAGVASLSVKENASGTVRVLGKLVLPTLETVSGDTDLGFTPAPSKAFEVIGDFEMVFPNRSSLQNRKDLKAMLIDFMGDAIVTAAVETFTHPSA
jgi:hypothetical protein